MWTDSSVLCRVIHEYLYIIYICHTAVEWTDPSKSALCTMSIILFFSIGLMVLSGIAYLIQTWRILQLVLFSPLVLLLGFLYWSATHQITIHWLFFKVQFAKNMETEIFLTCVPIGFSQSQLAGWWPWAGRRRQKRSFREQPGWTGGHLQKIN